MVKAVFFRVEIVSEDGQLSRQSFAYSSFFVESFLFFYVVVDFTFVTCVG